MKSILKELKTNPYIKLIAGSLRCCPQEAYLVGGFLRDLFLGRKKVNPDFDFAVSRDAIKIGREIAKSLKSGFVVLDEEHGSCRVIYKKGDFSCNFDFTDFRGRDISEDLLLRDFTINSLAVGLSKITPARRLEDVLIDKSSALKDIKKKIIKYEIKGCAVTTASASILSELNLTKLKKMTQKDLIKVLGFELTPARVKCAMLPLVAIKKALVDPEGVEPSTSTL